MDKANTSECYWIIRNDLIIKIMNAPYGITWGQLINQIPFNGKNEYMIIEIFNGLVEEGIIYEKNGYWYI